MQIAPGSDVRGSCPDRKTIFTDTAVTRNHGRVPSRLACAVWINESATEPSHWGWNDGPPLPAGEWGGGRVTEQRRRGRGVVPAGVRPDLNPIETAFTGLGTFRGKAAARAVELFCTMPGPTRCVRRYARIPSNALCPAETRHASGNRSRRSDSPCSFVRYGSSGPESDPEETRPEFKSSTCELRPGEAVFLGMPVREGKPVLTIRTMIDRLSGPLSRNAVPVLAASLAGLLGCGIMASVVASALRTGDWGTARLWALEPDASNLGSDGADYLLMHPGVPRPATATVGEVAWGDDEEVIGVAIAGQARAYLVAALERPARHVVNDVLGSLPVSVTYCNIDHCARAFSGEDGEVPLDLSVGGLHRSRSLLLLIGSRRYHQATLQPYEGDETGEVFPYREVPVSVTTWKVWRQNHPNTLASIAPIFDPEPPRKPTRP
jgi:Protein of unknown function (DUF3179)